MIETVERIEKLNIDKFSWTLTRLGDLATEISKRVDNPSESEYDRFVGLGNFVSGDIKIKTWEPTDNLASSAKAFKTGDILFARRNAYLRRASLVDFDGCCSGDAFVLRENHYKVVPGFLAFLLNSNALWDYANSNAAGTMSKRVKWRDLAEYQFLLPPKDQQAKLAKLLWAMDEVIERELEVLEKILVTNQSLFKSFRSKENNWKKFKIGDLMHFNYGKSLKESDRIEGQYSVITSSGYQGSHSEFLTKGPGIVVGRKGNVGQVTWVDNNFWTTDTAYYIDVKEEFLSIPLKFFYYLLKASNLVKHSIATAVPGLNRDDALMTKVYLPDGNELIQYLEKFQNIDNMIVEVESKITSSKALQKSLINQVF
ncbi:MAG: restriction endonuclease subunit S [Ignavibacteriae bacterium]|nr:restriction endonuclease subunit S [Ignavibacteriota bacterium]